METRKYGKAEMAFREAFARLKAQRPRVLPKGTELTQNNVAREAGNDPSALKKSRFPSLVREIQEWVREHGNGKERLARRSATAVQRDRLGKLKAQLSQAIADRDLALSALDTAKSELLELWKRVQELEGKKHSNRLPFRKPAGDR